MKGTRDYNHDMWNTQDKKTEDSKPMNNILALFVLIGIIVTVAALCCLAPY
jgi:hypothetical protein